MRILFAASADIALPCLKALIDSGLLVGLLTNPDKEQGRGMKEGANGIAAYAAAYAPGLPIFKFAKLDQDARAQIAALKPDLLAVFAYGKIFGPKFLSLFPQGGVNVHPSLLPKWRGCSPIPAAILAREEETGLSIQRLALKMDCGDILASERIALSGRESSASLSLDAARIGSSLLMTVIEKIDAGTVEGQAQDDAQASYCSFIKKEDGLIDWSLSALEIDARIRAYNPWPLAFSYFKGLRLSLLEAQALDEEQAPPHEADDAGKILRLDKKLGILIQTGRGILAVSRLQLEKKKALGAQDFLNGTRDFLGSRLHTAPS